VFVSNEEGLYEIHLSPAAYRLTTRVAAPARSAMIAADVGNAERATTGKTIMKSQSRQSYGPRAAKSPSPMARRHATRRLRKAVTQIT